MGILLLIVAIVVAIYGVGTGNELALVLAAVAMAIGSNRLLRTQATSELDRIRQMGGNLGAAPWLPLLVATLVCAALAVVRIRQADPDPVGFGLWAGSLILAVITGVIYDRGTIFWRRVGETVRWQRLDWLIALGLTVIALALRVYLLDQHLPAMHGDEGEMGTLARLALYGPGAEHGPAPLHFFRTAFLDHPNLFHYVQALGLRVFGDSEWGLKMVSAIFGALCAPLIYAVGRIGWGRVAGVVAGWLLAVSHLHIHYSRIALNNIQSVWFGAIFLLLVVMVYVAGERARSKSTAAEASEETPPPALPDTRLTIFVLIGLSVGLSQYFYYGSRLIAVVAVIFLLMLWRIKRTNLGYIVAAGGSAVLAFLPMLFFYANNFTSFISRMRGVSVLKPEGMHHLLGPDAVWPRDLPALLWTQLERNMDFFASGGDVSAFYTPMLPGFDVITVALFWLGLGLLISGWRRFPNQMITLWFAVGLFLGGVVTNDAPNGPRLIVVVLAVYVIAAVTMQRLFDAIYALWPTLHRRTLLAVATALCAITLYLNFNLYFVDFVRINPMLPLTEIATAMDEAGADNQVYLMGDPVLYADHGVLRFVAHDVVRRNLFNPIDIAALEANAKAADQDIYLIVLPARLADLDMIVQAFPEGVREEHYDHLNRLLYVSYHIPVGTLTSLSPDAAHDF